MASLIEEFIDVLEKEHSEYVKLLKLSKDKTPVIVKNDIGELQKITDEEQVVVEQITHLEKRRVEVLNDIATVINKDVNTLKIPTLLGILEKQPKEHGRLNEVHRKLKTVLSDMKMTNERNRVLIEQSLELIQFDVNLLQSMKQAPETGNYNKNAYNAGMALGAGSGGFDAKQ